MKGTPADGGRPACGLGSVVATVDPSGNVLDSRKYDVYGATRGGTASGTAHRFVGALGHASDDETGLTYMRARYYDAATGRFVSQDPKKNGTNWFAYANGDPVDLFDPDGRSTLSRNQWCGVAAAAIATAAWIWLLAPMQAIEKERELGIGAIETGAVLLATYVGPETMVCYLGSLGALSMYNSLLAGKAIAAFLVHALEIAIFVGLVEGGLETMGAWGEW